MVTVVASEAWHGDVDLDGVALEAKSMCWWPEKHGDVACSCRQCCLSGGGADQLPVIFVVSIRCFVSCSVLH